jgi:hypothetical protein
MVRAMPNPTLRTLSLFLGALLPVGAAWAQNPPAPLPEGRPLWEAGVAVLGANGPDYPAAGTRRWRGAVAPILIYRGPWLKVDDDGVRGELLQSGNLRLDFSGAAGFNARANGARAGMPDLDYLFQLGPQAVYKVKLDGGQQVSAHLKARAVFSTDGRHTNGRGVVVEQEFRWTRRGWPDAESQVQAGAQFLWGSEKLHDYFYQVDPAYATATRPAYDARAGYFGSTLRAGYVRRLTSTLSATAGASVNFHAGAANEDSPLFQKRTTAGVLVALIWTPWRSDARAAAEP